MTNEEKMMLIHAAAVVAGGMLGNGYKVNAANESSVAPLVKTAVTVARAIVKEIGS